VLTEIPARCSYSSQDLWFIRFIFSHLLFLLKLTKVPTWCSYFSQEHRVTLWFIFPRTSVLWATSWNSGYKLGDKSPSPLPFRSNPRTSTSNLLLNMLVRLIAMNLIWNLMQQPTWFDWVASNLGSNTLHHSFWLDSVSTPLLCSFLLALQSSLASLFLEFFQHIHAFTFDLIYPALFAALLTSITFLFTHCPIRISNPINVSTVLPSSLIVL